MREGWPGVAAKSQTFQEFCRLQALAAKDRESPPPNCSQCAGKGFVWREKEGYRFVVPCSCQKDIRLRAILEEANMPPKYWDTTLHRQAHGKRLPFKTPRGLLGKATLPKALDVCRNLRDMYIDAFINGKAREDMVGLMLYGKAGLGKTRLVCALLRDLIEAGLHQVAFVEYNELFKLIRFSFNSKDISYRGILEPLLRAKVLVVDDLGTDMGGDLLWVLDNIGFIINERYSHNLPTLFTCNYWMPISRPGEPPIRAEESQVFEMNSWETTKALRNQQLDPEARASLRELGQRISYRLRSRIHEMCLEVPLEGSDYRKTVASKRNHELEIRWQGAGKKPAPGGKRPGLPEDPA